ncbi:peroxiredoxin family protein [candidate division KSB1 bacterium]
MRLKNGNKAKDFEVSDIYDKSIKLADYKGKYLLLSFYRYASCPFCNLRIHRLIEIYEDLQSKGLEMAAFFQSPKESIMQYAGEQSAPFPIIPDPERNIYREYGIESSWSGMLKSMIFRLNDGFGAIRKGFLPGKMEGVKALIPADFLISPDQIIHKAYYGKDIGDHIPVDDIYKWLKNNRVIL